jgi:hypothetical protein
VVYTFYNNGFTAWGLFNPGNPAGDNEYNHCEENNRSPVLISIDNQIA